MPRGHPKKPSPLRKWMMMASMEQKARLAELSGVHLGYLYHLADGRRQASADIAGRIEEAIAALGGAQKVGRGDMCRACRKCPYYKRDVL